jgi:adenylylsulfate kinase-like enzyme
MDITTLQVVEERAAKGVEPDSEEFEVAEGITNEAEEPEAPELSIAELEEIFSELN